MACTGYEHGSRVELTQPLSNANIPVGATGRVVGIDHSDHRLDVFFDAFGLFRDLDPHCFQLLDMLA